MIPLMTMLCMMLWTALGLWYYFRFKKQDNKWYDGIIMFPLLIVGFLHFMIIKPKSTRTKKAVDY